MSHRNKIVGHRANTEVRPYGWTTAIRGLGIGAGFRNTPIHIRYVTLWLCMFFWALALATTYPKLSLETQLERAEIIVRATIKAVAVEERNKRPWTVYTLESKQYWRGEGLLPKSNALPSFAIFGSDKIKLEGAPSFKVGDEWIFLLYSKNYDSPIVGFNQGAYKLEGTGVLDTNNKPVQLEGKPATKEGFIAALEKILGVVR
jgi:hypothetical protein